MSPGPGSTEASPTARPKRPMSRRDVRDEYHLFTGKLSDITRQLSLAGIAVVWVFKITQGEDTVLPTTLFRVSLCLVGALAAEALQYASAAIAYGVYNWQLARRGVELDAQVERHGALNLLPLIFFVLKIVALTAGYALLLTFLLDKIKVV
jgi:hypothetical protein